MLIDWLRHPAWVRLRRVDEHEMQAALVTRWAQDGAWVDGERCFLAAWEVSTDYSINDASTSWGRPALDFVLLDEGGRMVLLELKPAVTSPRECWSVLCQVTHRAAALAGGFTLDRLSGAHAACFSGRHGRVPLNPAPHDLTARARDFFDDDAYTVRGVPARRMVGAQRFAPRWSDVRAEFTTGSPRAAATIAKYAEAKSGREFRRHLALPPRDPAMVTTSVETCTFAL